MEPVAWAASGYTYAYGTPRGKREMVGLMGFGWDVRVNIYLISGAIKEINGLREG